MYILLLTSDHKRPTISVERDSLIHLHVTLSFQLSPSWPHQDLWWSQLTGAILTAPGGPGNSSSISLLPTSHLGRAEDNTLHSTWRGTGEKGLLELDPLLLQRYALSLSLLAILTVLLHFWMADGCIVCKPPSPHTHSVCLACPEMVGFWKHQVQLLGLLVGETFASWAR